MPTRAATSSEAKRLAIVQTHDTRGPRDGDPSAKDVFARDVREGLLASPKTLPFQYFYDEAGSDLFERICRLPEYYLTRTEDAILRRHAAEMVDGWFEAPTLVELGSGSSEKTRHLIAAALAQYGRLHYVPIDVSETAVESSARQLVRTFPDLRVTAFVGDYNASLAGIAVRFRGPKLIAFLGSSLGNYETEGATDLLRLVSRSMGPKDRFLLGTDLAKDPSVLEAAYDDAQGVTAQFNKNLLVRINRELGADFAVERFRHRAVYRPEAGRVEMNLVSLEEQSVRIPAAEVTVRFAPGETIHTENSHKYTTESLAALAGEAGFTEEAVWSDADGWFRVQRWAKLRE